MDWASHLCCSLKCLLQLVHRRAKVVSLHVALYNLLLMHRMLLLDGVLYCPATLLSVLVRPHFLRAECAGLSMSCPVRHSLTCALSDFLPSGRDRLRPMHSNGLSDVLVCIITDMAFLVAKRWWELGFVYSKLHTIDCPNMGFRVWGHVGHSYLFFCAHWG